MMNPNEYRQGPAYLEGITIPKKPESWHEVEWTGKLSAEGGAAKFHIFYYGELIDDLISSTDFAPPLIIAEDTGTGKRFVLFDGCRHGYDAMLCEIYSEEQHNERKPLLPYVDADGEDTFEVLVTVYYNVDWDEEFGEDVDEDGKLELLNGEKCDFEVAKRNGFDAISISIMNSRGLQTDIAQEELA